MNKECVKGFKVFNHDWTCRGFKYEVGGVYEEDVKPEICKRGFHFYEKAADCFRYYLFNTNNRVAEVVALGEVVSDDTKSCTNKIQIVREIPWQELLEIVNTGKGCTGLCNSGNRNSGDWNSGSRNSGNYNSGDYNSGDYNSGNYNSGDYNSGNYNSGDYNSGDWNSGHANSGDWNSGNYNSGNCNSGDWNKTNHANGCFNTAEPKIYLFDKPSEWTYSEWRASKACDLLIRIPGRELKYVYLKDMTDEEKQAHPEAETTGGYLKVLDNSECAVIWWRGLSKREKGVIKAIPNFDAAIFKDITGVDTEEE